MKTKEKKSGGGRLSYFLNTAIFTAITLFLWWYFLVHRASKRANPSGGTKSPGVLGEFRKFRDGFFKVGRILCGLPRKKKASEHEMELPEA